MQKTDFIARVAEQTGVTKKTAREVIEAALNLIADSLMDDEKVVLTRFGTFELRTRRARRGVNPRTGQEMLIPSIKVPSFSPSASFRRRVYERERMRGE